MKLENFKLKNQGDKSKVFKTGISYRAAESLEQVYNVFIKTHMRVRYSDSTRAVRDEKKYSFRATNLTSLVEGLSELIRAVHVEVDMNDDLVITRFLTIRYLGGDEAVITIGVSEYDEG